MVQHFAGLIAAPHTPFRADGELRLESVPIQAQHLARQDVRHAFIGGTTGECSSMTTDERLALAEAWSDAVAGIDLSLVLHVGHNSVEAACRLSRQAAELRPAAISAVAPSYLKPESAEALVAYLVRIADCAPDIPFYYYDIPALTGVEIPVIEVAALAVPRIANFAGFKFTNHNYSLFQEARVLHDGNLELLWGNDEELLVGLSLGARAAVGSTYNFCPAVYQRLMAAFADGDLEAARREQLHSLQLVRLLAGYGYMAAAKTVMSFLGVDVGAPRLPLLPLSKDAQQSLREELEALGFFDWALQAPAVEDAKLHGS